VREIDWLVGTRRGASSGVDNESIRILRIFGYLGRAKERIIQKSKIFDIT
jgi:hypothetical protein